MSDAQDKPAKLDVQIGKLKFVGEGDQQWLATQLASVISLAETIKTDIEPENSKDVPAQGSFTTALGSYIREKNADGNQNLRFLVSADWLRRRGMKILTTSAVSKALQENQQKRLGNPADCLNQNVSKGFCEKTKDGFFVTPEGLRHLGHTN
ncbi:MAG: hypothetical protein NW215_08325 [Hyphomicrobiales bacterium]|nr:hypothetical protein [Hyphomicrobiales bacterium]